MNSLPPPVPLAPIMRDQRKTDADHLRLLSVFHFVVAGLSLVGIGFLFLHYTILSTVLSNPEVLKNPKGRPPPAEFFAMFKWFYVLFGGMLVLSGIGNLLSGLFIRQRKHRIFSLVIAGLDCVQMPFGTTLGVFTFIVLLRDSVREVYEA